MTNYEKLCKLLDITMQPHNYYYTGRVWHYPIFDEKKQIELIKLIISDGTLMPLHLITEGKENTYIIGCYGGDYYGKNTDFFEALAGLVLQLIEAGELDKEEVRRILE